MSAISPALPPTTIERRRLESEPGVEWVDGQLVEKNVSIDSSATAASILILLGTLGRKHGWRVFDSSLGYKVFANDPERFRKPDVSAVLTSRLADVDGSAGFSRLPADLAVEAISPGDEAYEISRKVEEYLSAGFRMVWVVYPHVRAVEVHRQGGRGEILRVGQDLDASDVLPGLRCPVAELFES
jgi:Uma2 family endonuclease